VARVDRLIIGTTKIADKRREIRAQRCVKLGAAARAEKSVKVISSIQAGRYTRHKEYRFKQSSA
jgi:hypothetical protein